MIAYDTRDYKRGLKVLFGQDPWSIVDFQHVNPGKGAAFTRVKMKNLRTGQVVENTIKAGDKLEKPNVEEKMMQYLYKDSEGVHFMDTQTFDQISLTEEDVGDALLFMVDNSTIRVLFFNDRAIGVESETFVELRVIETTDAVKGNTSTNATKAATMETGLVLQVPFHINVGDLLKIDTRTTEYAERIGTKF
jgi:elongation factor P